MWSAQKEHYSSSFWMAICVIFLSSYIVADFVNCTAACSHDLDCSLNGVCAHGKCVCDPGWTGSCCGQLDLTPVDYTTAGGGYRHNLTSTWGGNILTVDDGKTYHMWIAEMKPNGTGGDPGAGSCGLTSWQSNSQVTHVVASSPLGPYKRMEVAVPVWTHNPIVRTMPDGTLVMYHIGDGSTAKPATYCAANATSKCGTQSWDPCVVPSPCDKISIPGWTCHPSTCSSGETSSSEQYDDCGSDLGEPTVPCNGTWEDCAPKVAATCASTAECESFSMSDAWEGLNKAKLYHGGTSGLVPNSQWVTFVKETTTRTSENDSQRSVHTKHVEDTSDGSCTLYMHTAKSVNGPWTIYSNATITPCGSNNPAPWVHPNGTIYIVFTNSNMGLWRADSWAGPYTFVTSGACGGGEDPSLWIDKRGHWHCLYHRRPFGNPDIAIGHTFSVDGFQWVSAAAAAANSTIASASHGVVVHGKRERPHLYFDRELHPTAFVSGVCITPSCDKMAGTFDPAADCTSATQYHHCDSNSPYGWYDRTYTLVQGISTDKSPKAP
eukprot:m.71682 g.71682  ORF g.71682 m.71682 type:complete len:549 (+) comp16090_c0_seq1:181-1827(+)